MRARMTLALRCRARAGFSRRSRENPAKTTLCVVLGPASRVKPLPASQILLDFIKPTARMTSQIGIILIDVTASQIGIIYISLSSALAVGIQIII